MSDFRFLILAAAASLVALGCAIAYASAEEDAQISACLATSKDSCACLAMKSADHAEACYEAKGQ